MTDHQKQLFNAAKKLSPRRNTTDATNIQQLAAEQLAHFNIEVDGELGRSLLDAVEQVYQCQGNIERMWEATMQSMQSLDATEKTALFNAKKFLSFQLAKVLDTLQNPFRANYQQLQFSQSTLSAKSAYPRV